MQSNSLQISAHAEQLLFRVSLKMMRALLVIKHICSCIRLDTMKYIPGCKTISRLHRNNTMTWDSGMWRIFDICYSARHALSAMQSAKGMS